MLHILSLDRPQRLHQFAKRKKRTGIIDASRKRDDVNHACTFCRWVGHSCAVDWALLPDILTDLPAQHLQHDEDHDRQAKSTAEQPDQKGPACRGHRKNSCQFQHKSLLWLESHIVIRAKRGKCNAIHVYYRDYLIVITNGETNITGLC